MNFHVLTLFPEMIEQGMTYSIIGRAIGQGQIKLHTVNIRDFSQDKHRKVDDYTYGGGAGMLMQPEPVYRAWRSLVERDPLPDQTEPDRPASDSVTASCDGQASDSGQKERGSCRTGKPRTIYVTPQGVPFSQKLAEDLAREDELILLCGHYEGIDERVLEETVTDYVSIGDYVLTGGELAAMVIMDAVARLVPGVLHNDESALAETFHGGLLEYPQYTRPELWHEKAVPAVLLSGDQRRINAWRREQSEARTRERRPELYETYDRLMECRQLLGKQKLLHIDMLQMIDRGNAGLIYARDGEILLRERQTGLYLHTDPAQGDAKPLTADKDAGGGKEADGGRRALTPAMYALLKAEGMEADGSRKLKDVRIVFHQRSCADAWCEALSLSVICSYAHAVCTRREKLPVSGLYRADGRPMDRGENEGLVIRGLGPEHTKEVISHYRLIDDPDYIRDRIAKKQLYGAFLPDESGQERLAAFVGFHAEGSCGLLEVFPEYRRRHLAMALETYIINLCLDRGWTAYGQIIADNAVSMKLQNRMKLALSEPKIYRVGTVNGNGVVRTEKSACNPTEIMLNYSCCESKGGPLLPECGH